MRREILRETALGAVGAALVLSVTPATAVASQQGTHGRLFPPQDLGLLEEPDRDAWQRPDQIMDALSIADGAVVADLGAGGGWFMIRLARRVGPNGAVYAEDIQRPMIEAIERRIQREGLRNVRTVLGSATDPKLPPESLDAILIVDTYYEVEDPITMLQNVLSSLKPKGRVAIIDFKLEGGGPGPPTEDRIDPEMIIRDAERAGLRLIGRNNFPLYEYFLVFGR